jgi:hypothetical protein
MCNTVNSIGSLTKIKSDLHGRGIYDFKSLNGLIEFQNSYGAHRREIILHHESLIKQERDLLDSDLQQLGSTIENEIVRVEKELALEIEKLKEQFEISSAYTPNYFRKLVNFFRKRHFRKTIKNREENFDANVSSSISELVNVYREKDNRIQFICAQFGKAVEISARHPLFELDRRKKIIDELRSYIYGAFGEEKVVKTLETLSNDFFLINDFSISFSPAVFNSQEGNYIKSVQIDHILIAPSGIFLIETKNWSESSLKNRSLRSPVEQVKRSSSILFRLLNNEIGSCRLHLSKHHWGERSIPIRNLIVFINTKPKEEFKYVKILTLNELLGFVEYFEPIFSNADTKKIADFLLKLSNQKEIVTSR